MDPEGLERRTDPNIVRKVVSYALVEYADGTTVVEPVLMLTSADVAARAEVRAARSLASMVGIRQMSSDRDLDDPAGAYLPLDRQLMLVSDFMRCPTNLEIQRESEYVQPTIDNCLCLLTSSTPGKELGWPTVEAVAQQQ